MKSFKMRIIIFVCIVLLIVGLFFTPYISARRIRGYTNRDRDISMSELLLMDSKWRSDLGRFLELVIDNLTSAQIKVYKSGKVYLNLEGKLREVYVGKEWADEYVEVKPVEFEKGVRGIQVWKREENVINFILSRDGKYVDYAQRCDIEGRLIISTNWRWELKDFLKYGGESPLDCIVQLLSGGQRVVSGKISLHMVGEHQVQVAVKGESPGTYLRVRPIEFKDGVRGIQLWKDGENVENYILFENGEYLISPKRCNIEGEFIGDVWWWTELKEFLEHGKTAIPTAVEEVGDNGKIYLGKKIGSIYVGEYLSGEYLEIRPMEFKDGVTGIQLWRDGENVENFILFQDGEYLIPGQHCDIKGRPIIDRGWRSRLKRFLKYGGSPPYSVLAKVYSDKFNKGKIHILAEVYGITVSAELAGSWVEIRPMEFKDGVRGVQIWVGSEDDRIPIVSWVLYRDGRFVRQRFPYLGWKGAPVFRVLRKVRAELGPGFSFEEYREKLKELTLSVEEWRLVLRQLSLGQHLSLDAPLSMDDGRTLLDVVTDEKALDPEEEVLARESIPPFEEWLTEGEFNILTLMFEEEYDILPLEIADRKLARENGIMLKDIQSVRSKLEVLLAFWNGDDMRLCKDERIRRLVLKSLPVVLRDLEGNGRQLRTLAEELLERIKLLVKAGWKDEEAIEIAATYSTQDIIKRMLLVRADEKLGKSIPFAINAMRGIEQHPERLSAFNASLAARVKDTFPTLTHQLLGERVIWEERITSNGVVDVGGERIYIGEQRLEIIKGKQQDKELIIVLDKDTGGVASFLVEGDRFSRAAMKQQIVEDLETTAIGSDKGPYSLEVRPVETGESGSRPISFHGDVVRFNPPKGVVNINRDVVSNSLDTIIVYGRRNTNADILIINRWSAESGVFSVRHRKWLGDFATTGLSLSDSLKPIHWLATTPITQWWIEYIYPETGGVSGVGGIQIIPGDYNKERMRIFKDWTGKHVILHRMDTQQTYILTLTEENYMHETDGVIPVTPGTNIIPLVELARSGDYPKLAEFYTDVEKVLTETPNDIPFGSGWGLRRNELPFEVKEIRRICRDIVSVTLVSNGEEVVIKGEPTGYYIGDEWYSGDEPGVVSAQELLIKNQALQNLVKSRFDEFNRFRMIGAVDLNALLAASKWIGKDRDEIDNARSELRQVLDSDNHFKIALVARKILNLIFPDVSKIRLPDNSGRIQLPGCNLSAGFGTVVFESEEGNLQLVRLERYAGVENFDEALKVSRNAYYNMKYSPKEGAFITSEASIFIPKGDNPRIKIFENATERSTDGNLLRPEFYNIFVDRLIGDKIPMDENKISVGAYHTVNPSGVKVLEQRRIQGRIDGVTVEVDDRRLDIRGEDDGLVIERRDEDGQLIYSKKHKWPVSYTDTIDSLAYKDDAVFWLFYQDNPGRFSERHYQNLPSPRYLTESIDRLIESNLQLKHALLLNLKGELVDLLGKGADFEVRAQRITLQVLDVLWEDVSPIHVTSEGHFSLASMDWVFGRYYVSEPDFVIPFVLSDGYSIRLWRLSSAEVFDIPYDAESNSYWLNGKVPQEINEDDPNRIPLASDSNAPESRIWLAWLTRKTDGEGNYLYRGLFQLLARYEPVNQEVGRKLKAGLRYDDAIDSKRSRKRPTLLLFDEYDAQRLSCLYRIKIGLTTVGVVLENSRGKEIEIFILPEGAVIGGKLIKRSSWISTSPYHRGRIKNCNLRAVMNQNATLWSWFNGYGEGYFNIDGIIGGLGITSNTEVQRVAVSALLKGDELTSTGKLLTDSNTIDEYVFQKVKLLLEILRDETEDDEFSERIALVLQKLEQERILGAMIL